MFQPSTQGAVASTVCADSTAPSPLPAARYETVRHMVFGSVGAVQYTIKLLYKLNYADPNDWSKPVPTGQPNEVVVVLTKKVRVG